MAVTKTTTGSLSGSIPDYVIKKKILAHGKANYRYREMAAKEPFEKGGGSSIKFVRYPRLVLAEALTEGTPPTAITLDVETVTGTATQYGQAVGLSDRLQYTMWHPVMKKAYDLVAEGAARLDDALIQKTCIAGTNVIYGAGVASRAALATASYVTTTQIRKAVSTLSVGSDNTDGGVGRFPDGYYHAIIHEKMAQQLRFDSTWDAAMKANPDGLKGLEQGLGQYFTWEGVKFFVTNFGHTLTQQSTIGTISAYNGTGTLAVGSYVWGVTRVHKKRGLEEGIRHSSGRKSASGSNDTLRVTMPSDTNYTYNLYFADVEGSTGTRRLVSSNHAASSVPIILAVTAATATAEPAQPSSTVTVYTCNIFGPDAYAVSDLDTLKTYMTTGSDKTDFLDQQSYVGCKWDFASLILRSASMVRIESPVQI